MTIATIILVIAFVAVALFIIWAFWHGVTGFVRVVTDVVVDEVDKRHGKEEEKEDQLRHS